MSYAKPLQKGKPTLESIMTLLEKIQEDNKDMKLEIEISKLTEKIETYVFFIFK